MQSRAELKNEEPESKVKMDRFTWWQSTLLLVSTLVICLTAGYYISDQFLWDKSAQAKQIDDQITFYKEEVKQKPNDPKNRVQLGYSYFLKKDYDEAIKQYKTAISLDDNFFDAYLNLSIVYDKQDRTDDALQNAIKATEISPRDYKGHILKGKSYRKLKMYDEANEALAEADRLNAGNVDTIYEIGLVAENQGKKKDAEAIYKEALTFDPLFKPALEALERIASKE